MKKIVLIFFALAGCVMDRLNKVAVFKNNTGENLVMYYSSFNDTVTLEEIYYGSSYPIPANQHNDFRAMGVDEKMGFFFFNEDSLKKYTKADSNYQNIYRKCFRKFIPLNLNRNIKDTVYIIY